VEGGRRKAEWKTKTVIIALACLFIAQCARAEGHNFINRLFFEDYQALGGAIAENPVKSALIAAPVLLTGWLVYANDRRLADWLKEGKSSFKDDFFNYANYGGDGVFVLAANSFLFLGGEREKRSAQLVIESIVVSGSITYLIKAVAGRARPSDSEDPYRFKPFSFSDASMPSGHSAVAFSWAAIIGDAYNIGYITYPLAALCAWARVYRSAHWPSDVLIGGVIGVVTAKSINAARLQEMKDSGGPAFAMDPAGSPVLMFNFKI